MCGVYPGTGVYDYDMFLDEADRGEEDGITKRRYLRFMKKKLRRIYHKIKWLNKTSFPESIHTKFDNERLLLHHRMVGISTGIAAGIAIVLMLYNVLFKTAYFSAYIPVGVAIICVSVFLFVLSRQSNLQKHANYLNAVLILTVGIGFSTLCPMNSRSLDPYILGVVLTILGGGMLLPFTLLEGLCIFIPIGFSYVIPNLFIFSSKDTKQFFLYALFIIISVGLAILGTQFHLYYRKHQWINHQRLKNALKKIRRINKEKEIVFQERTEQVLQSERLAVVGQLAGGIAHDFNNMLTAILGISDLVVHSMDQKDPLLKDVESIGRVANSATDLIKQLLAFSRRQILMPKPLNLNDVLRDVKKILTRVIGEDIDLIVCSSLELGSVLADPVQVEQIILNLAVNARDAMPDGGKLIIETSNARLDACYCNKKRVSIPPGDYIMLAVSDTGHGMRHEVKQKIFEPFFTTKSKGKGTGLGLSSVYGIVKQSNGDIRVYSEEGRGTSFKIYLPRIKEQGVKMPGNDYNLTNLPKGKETILFVEDEEVVRKPTARMLELQGYRVVQASEGMDALAISDSFEGTIDLLLTDVVMPNMSGKSLAEQILQTRKNVKILYLSGYTENMIRHQGIACEGGDFLQKPFTADVLMKKIRDIFECVT